MPKNGLSVTQQTLPTTELRRRGKKFPQYIAAATVCLAAITSGTVTGWTGNITDELQKGHFNNIDIDSSDIKWIGSSVTLGAIVMCFPSGIICEKLGRKVALFTLALLFIGGWLLIVLANSVLMICVGRSITGMGSGAFHIICALYVSEIAEKEVRGTLMLLAGNSPPGIMLVYLLGYAVDVELCTIIVAVIPFLFMLSLLFQPETPLFKIKQGKEAEAKSILIRLRGDSYNVDAELKEIKATVEKDKEVQVFSKDSIMKRSTIKAAIICFGLMFFSQAGGFKVVLFYTSDIFDSSGAALDPKLSTVMIGVVLVISGLAAFLIIDKLERRTGLLVSGSGTALGLLIIGTFFTLYERSLTSPDILKNLGFMPLLGLILFNVTFAIGYGPLPWMMCAELLPPEIKGVVFAAANTFSWFMGFLITNLYFDLKAAIGGDSTFYVFAAVCVISVVFALFVPETKGKSLYQIQTELNGKRNQLDGVEGIAFD